MVLDCIDSLSLYPYLLYFNEVDMRIYLPEKVIFTKAARARVDDTFKV